MAILEGVPITISEFKDFFDRDFVYGNDISSIRDKDIERSLNDGVCVFNSSVWDTEDSKKIAYMYLSAHLLVLNIKAAGGINRIKKGLNSTGSFPMNTTSAGGLSAGYAMDKDITDNPILSQFHKTEYGQKYLQLIQSTLVGNVFISEGATAP